MRTALILGLLFSTFHSDARGEERRHFVLRCPPPKSEKKLPFADLEKIEVYRGESGAFYLIESVHGGYTFERPLTDEEWDLSNIRLSPQGRSSRQLILESDGWVIQTHLECGRVWFSPIECQARR